jgi:aspartate oxidase
VIPEELRHLWLEIEGYYRKTALVGGLIGLRNSDLAGMVVARAALRNKKSRGTHFREENFLGEKPAVPLDSNQI